MKRAEITYIYNKRKHTVYEDSETGWEDRFYEYTVNRIKQITNAGAIIVKVTIKEW